MNKKDKEKAINDVLQRLQEGLRTQDLTYKEAKLLSDRFGHNWFEDLGYGNMKFNKDPNFLFKSKKKRKNNKSNN